LFDPPGVNPLFTVLLKFHCEITSAGSGPAAANDTAAAISSRNPQTWFFEIFDMRVFVPAAYRRSPMTLRRIIGTLRDSLGEG
jgi:hypothetical protein